MGKNRTKISFDLNLTNKIYKANIKSLIDLGKDNLSRLPQQHSEFIKELQEIDYDKKDPDGKWLIKSAHLANADWLLLNSLFIACLAHFEHHLFALASILESRKESKIMINDITGNGIYRYRKYCDLVGEISAASENENWKEIENYQKLRNKIIHGGGIILNDPSKSKNLKNDVLYKFAKSHDAIVAGSLGRIRIINTTILGDFYKISSILSDRLTREISEKFSIIIKN